MTQAQPPAAPPAPATPTPTSFADSDASAAAAARLAEVFPDGTAPGAPAGAPPAAPAAPGAPEAPEVDFFSDQGLDSLDFGNIPYRDGQKLRGELVRARDRYKPFNDAFSGMTDEARQALLESSPTLGDDLGVMSQTMARLHPDDRAYFQQAMDALGRGDIAGGAEMLANGAAQIRTAYKIEAPQAAPLAPGESAQPEWAQPAPAGEFVAPETPMTRAEVEAMLGQEREARAFEQTVAESRAQILAKARELGYDPDAQEGSADEARFQFFLTQAGRLAPGTDLSKAHEVVQGLEQAAIDRFVQAKSADATRPAAPAIAGVAPAETRTLETMPDGHAAMTNRLDATLGPDPRRRVIED